MDYTVREMLEALDNRKPVHRFLTDFFPTHNFHVNNLLEIDIKKGKRILAPLVANRKNGKILERSGFESFTLQTPKIAPERVITVDDISQRGFGENVYTKKTPAERAIELLASDITDLEDAIARRLEWMARELLFNGKISVTDKQNGLDLQIDYRFTNRTTLDISWKLDTSNPIIDLQNARKTVIQKTGKAPNICIMSSDVADDFLNNANLKSMLDIRNLQLASLTPTIKNTAVTFLGKIYQLGLELYTYDEWFINDENIEQPIIPSGFCILLPSDLGSIEYGGITVIEDGVPHTYSSDIVAQTWTIPGDNNEMLRLTSRPLLRPYDVDSWFVINIPSNTKSKAKAIK